MKGERLMSPQDFHGIHFLQKYDKCVVAKKEFWQMMGVTKLHGCYRLYAGKLYSKIFWLSTMIGAGIAFTIVALGLIYHYQTDNIDTQVQIVYDFAEKPVISVCSYNVIRKSYVEELMKTRGFSLDLLHYLMYAYSPLVDYAQRIQKEEMNYGQQLLDEYVKYHPNFTIRSFVENASQRCEDYILKCLYQGTQFDCCDSNYTTPIMTDLGRCYQTDLEKLHHDINLSYKFGAAQGLQMMLDYRTDEELPISNTSATRIRRPFLNTFEDGFRINVHNRMAVSFMSSEIISVSPNNKIAIALRPTKYEFLERSVGGACRRTWPIGYPNYQIAYSETLCRARCIVHKYVKSCGCAPLRYDILKDQNTCTPKQLHDCIDQKFAIVASTGGRDLMPNCEECAQQCENFVYYSHCSYARDILPATVEYMGQLGPRFTPEYVRQNMVGMAVFFESKKFVLYSQSRLSDLTNVLSNIGGNMGLFHGASVISLFEMALVTIKVIWSLFSSKRQHYVQSKHMKEDIRKKRLEEILTETNLYTPEPLSSSETSEETGSCDQDITDIRTSLSMTREEDENDHVAELSAENLNIKMVRDGCLRSDTVSLFITSSLAEALLDRDIAFAKTIRVGFVNNKIVIPQHVKHRSHTVV